MPVMWILGSESFKFEHGDVLPIVSSDGAGMWQVKGNTENVNIDQAKVSVSPDVQIVTEAFVSAELSEMSRKLGLLRISGLFEYSTLPLASVIDGNSSNENAGEKPHRLNHEKSIFYFWFENELSERIWIDTIVFADEPIGKKHVFKYVEIPEQAVSVHAGLLMRNFESLLTLSNVEFNAYKKRLSYKLLMSLVLGAMLIVLAVIVVKTVSVIGFSSILMVGILGVVVFFGLLVPGNELEKLLIGFFRLFGLPIDRFGHPKVDHIHAVSHVLIFLIVTYIIFSIGTQLKVDFSVLIVLTVLLMCVSEIAQLHIIDRKVEFLDIVFNLIGVLLGLLFWKSAQLFQLNRAQS